MTIEFQGWPKTPRLFRDSVITEKIDGTNAAVGIKFEDDDSGVTVYAQSRNRLITPDQDNYGFAAWVQANRLSLCEDLGPGLHFGEWWGKGIQRGYGLDHRRFSLFNTGKWSDSVFSTPNLGTVPVLAKTTFNTSDVLECLAWLETVGSSASPGFKPAEGVCVYHTASGKVFKATIENDQQPKSFEQRFIESMEGLAA